MKGVKTIKQAATEEYKHILGRKNGEITSMRMPWPGLNKAGIDGSQWGNISLIAGTSGSGKTAFANQLATEVEDCNPYERICVLIFTIEMDARRLVGRSISNRMQKTIQHLYTKISNKEMERLVTEVLPEIVEKNIYYIEIAKTAKQTRRQLEEFYSHHKNEKILVIYDHTLLVKREPSEGERESIVSLLSEFNELKKIYPHTQYFVLSQLNRNIQDNQRVSNPKMHYPIKGDISTSDGIFQYSDFVMIIHDPYSMGIPEYGVRKYKTKDVIFGHILKARDGKPNGLVFFHNTFKNNKLIQMTPKEMLKRNFIKSLPPRPNQNKFTIGLR